MVPRILGSSLEFVMVVLPLACPRHPNSFDALPCYNASKTMDQGAPKHWNLEIHGVKLAGVSIFIPPVCPSNSGPPIKLLAKTHLTSTHGRRSRLSRCTRGDGG
jgi:hypothetical protein